MKPTLLSPMAPWPSTLIIKQIISLMKPRALIQETARWARVLRECGFSRIITECIRDIRKDAKFGFTDAVYLLKRPPSNRILIRIIKRKISQTASLPFSRFRSDKCAYLTLIMIRCHVGVYLT
jgi:hypothetical protein